MVDIREVTYHGLSLKIKPSDEKPFYLTGDTTVFQLRIANLEDRRREGKISLKWRYGFSEECPHHPVPVKIDLGSNEVKEGTLIDEWHRYDGATVCTIEERGPPEQYVNMTMDDFIKQVKNPAEYQVLCSYRVMDRAIYNEEMRRHEELLREQRAVKENLEKLREDIVKVAREEARKEVLEKLVLGIQTAFSQEQPPAKKDTKAANIYG